VKIQFYANVKNPKACEAQEELSAQARAFCLEVVERGRADVVISLGGDGTLLKAVRRYPRSAQLGFNLGSLGYLAAVGENDFAGALKMLAEGRFKVSRRTLLEARKLDSREKHAIALNEIVIMRQMTGHAAAIDLEADGKFVARYSADGLVVATPTGSTAYSLAAGGPVLMPDSECMVVTPMNPHALGVRPLVVSNGVTLCATSRRRVNSRAEKTAVYADGRSAFMLGGDEGVVIRKALVEAKFVELEGYDPYEVLGRKLGWAGSRIARENRQ